ncbi:hypothetical protein OSTOST_20809, partial [Ostertagia ostertagi]
MSWKEEFSELLDFLDECTSKYPNRLFNVTPENDSTPVRRVAFSLENIIDQLRKPLVPSTQSLAQALVYKFNGPHRRQGYWMIYKNLVRALRKYNEDDLLTKVSDLHKKATASGAGFYMPSVEVMRYIGGAYLKRLFRLQQIRDSCIRTAHVIMGQLELGHWEKFSLFIVALCADVSNGIRMQAASMESAYDGLSKSIRPLDNRFSTKSYIRGFPETLAGLSIFSSLRGRISAQKNTDMSRVMRLLQFSDEQLDAVRTRDQMAQFREEILSNAGSKNEDLGEAIDRTEQIRVLQTPTFDTTRKPSSADSGLELGSEISMLDSTTDCKEQVSEEENSDERRPKLAKKRRRKRKNEINCDDISLLSPTSFTSPS